MTKIKQCGGNLFAVTGFEGGDLAGKEKAESFIFQFDAEGNLEDRYTSQYITEITEAVDAVLTKHREVIYLANAYATNGIAGSYVSIARNLTSVFVPLPSGLEIHPNPATDNLMITVEKGDLLGKNLNIYDAHGKKVLSQEAEPQVAIDHLDPGIYYLVLIDGLENYVHHFIKI